MDDYSDDENNSISSGYDSEESYESEEHNIKDIIGNGIIGGIKQIEEDEDSDSDNEDEEQNIDDENVDFDTYTTSEGGAKIANSDDENNDE